jgi:hypothetical protein
VASDEVDDSRGRFEAPQRRNGWEECDEFEPANFFGAAAQTIPVLLLTLAVETTFLAGALRSKRVEEVVKSGNWAVYLVDALLNNALIPLLARRD